MHIYTVYIHMYILHTSLYIPSLHIPISGEKISNANSEMNLCVETMIFCVGMPILRNTGKHMYILVAYIYSCVCCMCSKMYVCIFLAQHDSLMTNPRLILHLHRA